MPGLITIPLVDTPGAAPLTLAALYPEKAAALVRAAVGTFGTLSRLASGVILPVGDRISRAWLERTGNPYANEIAALAHALGVRGTYFLNVCFEWGCTSGVWNSDTGPVLWRVLDWPFPELGEHLVVARQSGSAGPFFNITWPGLSGVYHAMAPGRFAAAINQAPMRRHGTGYVGDWGGNRLAVWRSSGLPAAHLLRRAFETSDTYADARRLLSETALAVPAIFILAGARNGEGCIIERTEDDFAIRELRDGCVCATNHFQSRLNETGRGWRARPIDSAGRLACAQALTGPHKDFSWFAPPIANVNSRLALRADASAGKLSLIGTAGITPVTEIFRLGEAA